MIKKVRRLFSGSKRRIDPKFKSDFRSLGEMEKSSKKRFILEEKDFFPCLHDNTTNTGFDRHYVYHPAWAARIIAQIKPDKHVDISSTLHFCSVLSAFVPVDFYDYRPANLSLSNLNSYSADLLALPFPDNSL